MSKSIQMLGQDITVQFSNPDDWCQEGMGRSCVISSRILLREGMPNSVQCATFLHELMHQILGITALDDHNTEILVSTVAAGLLDFLRNNVDVAACLANVESLEDLVNKR